MGTALAFDIHDRLLKARRHAGLTQSQLAEALGIGRRSITRYEDGPAEPNRATILAWAMVTGTDPVWLETGRTLDGNESRWTTYRPREHIHWDMPEAA